MSNLTLRLPGLTTVGIMALASACTIVLFKKQQHESTQLVAALKNRHADEKVCLMNEKHLVQIKVIELKRTLEIAEATLAMQTRIAQIHEARVENYAGAQESSARLLEAGQEAVRKHEGFVAAAKEQIRVLEQRLKEVKEENARLREVGEELPAYQT